MTGTAILSSIDLPAEIGPDNVQWVHILPTGTNYARDGRGPFRLENASLVIEATRQYHGSTKMLVDYEHQVFNTKTNGKPVPAAGWIVALQSRADGIWAKTEWTSQAAEMIRTKEYRYLSPAMITDKSGKILRIFNVALTNAPALELTALAAAEISMNLEAQMTGLRALLNLPATADYDAVKAAIAVLQAAQSAMASAVPDPAQYVPIGEFTRVVQEANSLRQGISKQSAETYVEEKIREGKLVPYMKDWAIGLCSVNKPEFDRFITTTGPAFSALLGTVLPSGYKRGGASDALDESEMAVCTTLGLTTEQFIAARDSAGNAAE